MKATLHAHPSFDQRPLDSKARVFHFLKVFNSPYVFRSHASNRFETALHAQSVLPYFSYDIFLTPFFGALVCDLANRALQNVVFWICHTSPYKDMAIGTQVRFFITLVKNCFCGSCLIFTL